MVVQHDPERQRFFITFADGEAELFYAPFGDDILDLQHTEVPRFAQGRHLPLRTTVASETPRGASRRDGQPVTRCNISLRVRLPRHRGNPRAPRRRRRLHWRVR
jgi:hypothetical protein